MFGLRPLMLDSFGDTGGHPPATLVPSRLKLGRTRVGWVRTRAPLGICSTGWMFPEPPECLCGKCDVPCSRGPRARPLELLFFRILSSDSLYVGGRRGATCYRWNPCHEIEPLLFAGGRHDSPTTSHISTHIWNGTKVTCARDRQNEICHLTQRIRWNITCATLRPKRPTPT